MLAQVARCIRIGCLGTHCYSVNNQSHFSIYQLGNYSEGDYLGGFWDLVHREKCQLMSRQGQRKRLSSYINQKNMKKEFPVENLLSKKYL